MKAESSTIKSRIFLLAGGAIGPLRHRNNRMRRLRSYEFFDRSEQLIFLDGLGQKSGGALFDGAVAMFGAGARGDDDDALVLDAVDGFGGDGAASDRGRARGEDARSRWRRLQAPALAGFGGDHAIQVDQENQAAVVRDGCAGEVLDAAQILAEILDDDFVF